MFLFILVIAATVLVSDVVIKHALSFRTPIPRVLLLREITSPPPSMLTLAASQHKNPFIAEFVLLFEYMTIVVDYAVMKYVGDDVRILSRQENKHAVLHHAAVKQRKQDGEPATRWKWFVWLGDKVTLRWGRTLGISLVAHIEASSFAWLIIPAYFIKGLPNLFLFHGMEEIEHGALTVQSLRRQSNPILLLLTFPLLVIMHAVFLLCPPIVVLILRPRLLLILKTYLDLLSYYMIFGIAFIAAVLAQIIFCVFPFPENQTLYQAMHRYFNAELKARGVTFDIVERETYKLY